ncbi:hypothetical protein PSTT_00960 [Puccinia striiformis]|uniref:Uncharacterized protein n=1 Tax=Puccinia striiformis TaxID=27350 RepID=A0A2S4W544_9BASI|nr:hypothetical protein PSTT_00960 [Puccinia striiformis]
MTILFFNLPETRGRPSQKRSIEMKVSFPCYYLILLTLLIDGAISTRLPCVSSSGRRSNMVVDSTWKLAKNRKLSGESRINEGRSHPVYLRDGYAVYPVTMKIRYEVEHENTKEVVELDYDIQGDPTRDIGTKKQGSRSRYNVLWIIMSVLN